MRSVPEQPTATEQRDEPWAYFISTGQLRENKGGDVKRAGASARTSEHDRPIFISAKRSWCNCFCQPVDRRPLSHASHSFAVLAPAPRPAPSYFRSKSHFSDIPMRCPTRLAKILPIRPLGCTTIPISAILTPEEIRFSRKLFVTYFLDELKHRVGECGNGLLIWHIVNMLAIF